MFNTTLICPQIFIADAVSNAKNRPEIAQFLFEELDAPAVYFSHTGPLQLYAAGKTTGIAVNCGEDCTTILPVYEVRINPFRGLYYVYLSLWL